MRYNQSVGPEVPGGFSDPTEIFMNIQGSGVLHEFSDHYIRFLYVAIKIKYEKRCDMMRFSQRTCRLTSAIYTELETKKRDLVAQGREIFNFSIGTPDLPPPPHVMQVLAQETARPENYIYAIKDLPELIDAAIYWYQSRFAVTLQPDEIISLQGSQDGLSHISLALVDPGEIVLVPDPGYPIFSVGPFLAGAELYKMPLLPENNYLIDLEAIDPLVARRARLMIVSYPNNPVTATAPMAFYEKLVWFAKKYDIMVVHDNAYCELVFDGQRGGSFLQVPGAKDVGIEFNSLSKTYNIPGCRISFALGNSKIIEQLRNLKSHLDYGSFIPIQKAAVAALTGPQESIRNTVRTYQTRRDLLIEGLGNIGWQIAKNPATMFVWAPIPKSYSSPAASDPSLQFTFDLMEKTGVIVVPGGSFGEQGKEYVRIALVQNESKIQQALASIQRSGILI